MSTTSSRRRGIVTHDHRITAANIDTTETTATQAGPIPGPAVDQGASSTVVRTSGTMVANDAYTVTIRRGGYPGPGIQAAGFSYTRAGVEYYWDPPCNVSGRDFVVFNTAGSGTDDASKEYEPYLCRLGDGSVLMATRGKTNAGGVLFVGIRKYNPDANTWSSVYTITDDILTDTVRVGPCLVLMPNDDVHLYVFDYANNAIAMWVSTDDGATFSKASSEVMSTTLTGAGGYIAGDWGMQIQGTAASGQVVLIRSYEAYNVLNSDFWELCTSSDNGYTFIGDTGFRSDASYEDYQGIGVESLPGGGFWPVLGKGTAAGVFTPVHWPIGGGFYDLSTVGAAAIYGFSGGGTFSDSAGDATVEGGTKIGEFSACTWVGEDGTGYFAHARGGPYSPVPDRGAISVRRSTVFPGTDSWSAGSLGGQVIDHGSGASGVTMLHRCSAVETRGMTILASEVRTQTGDIDDGTIAVWYLGGHTSAGLPPSSLYGEPRQQWGWQYHALVDPDDGSAWTSAASTGSFVLESTGLALTCTSTQVYFFGPNAGEEPTDESAELLFEMSVSNVTASGNRIGGYITYRHAAGAAQYRVDIRVRDEIEFFNSTDGILGASTTVDATAETVELRVAIYRGRVNAWVRSVDSRCQRAWERVVTNANVTADALSVTTHVVRWGIITTGTGTDTVHIDRVQLMELDSTGTISSTGTASLPMLPRALASVPISLPGGLEITADAGPAVVGDSWVISTDYQYGFVNLFSANPGQVWRSTADNTAMTIAFDLSGASSGSAMEELYSLGAALLNSNLRKWQLGYQTYLAKGTTTNFVTCHAQPFSAYNPSAEEIASYENGSIMWPDSGGEPLRWLEADELAGCQVYDVQSDASYRIVRNSSGEWSGEYSHREAMVFLDREDTPSNFDGSTGAYIHLRDSACFYWGQPASGLMRWLVLTIPAQKTYEGYYQIGRLICGGLHVFGREYSEDRSLETRSNVELNTRRDGSRFAYSRGPQRRSVTVSWREGVDETDLYKTTEPKEVPFIAGFAASQPVANPADTVKLVRGLFGRVDGPTEPILYLPSIPTDIQSGSLTARDALLYGRIVSQIEIGQILGNEEEDQVHRLGAVRIEEEVG